MQHSLISFELPLQKTDIQKPISPQISPRENEGFLIVGIDSTRVSETGANFSEERSCVGVLAQTNQENQEDDVEVEVLSLKIEDEEVEQCKDCQTEVGELEPEHVFDFLETDFHQF